MRSVWCGLVLTAGVCVGCVSFPTAETPAKKPADKPAKARPARPPKVVVTPDLINETNGHEMGRALQEELNRETEGAMEP